MLLYSTIEVIMDITGGKQKGGAGDSDDEGRMEVYDRQVAWENALEYIRNNFMIVPRNNNNQVVPSNTYEPRPEDIQPEKTRPEETRRDKTRGGQD